MVERLTRNFCSKNECVGGRLLGMVVHVCNLRQSESRGGRGVGRKGGREGGGSWESCVPRANRFQSSNSW